jgi:ERCC4-type nuclease
MVETREKDRTTVLRDTREQRPWPFEDLPVETRDVTLSTGDYTVPAYCRHDSELDTYCPRFAIERKSAQDFLTAITWERERFQRELRRAAEWSRPLPVVIETSWQTLLRNRGCMGRRDIHPAQVVGTIRAWSQHYNVAFHFVETRNRAARCAFLLLLRHRLVRRLENDRSSRPGEHRADSSH